MRLENFTVDNYLRREFKFWKTLRKVYFEELPKDKVLEDLIERPRDIDILDLATKRFKSLTCIIKLLEPRHLAQITKLVNRRLDAGFDDRDLLDLTAIKKWKKSGSSPGSTMAFGFIEVVVAIIVAVIIVETQSSDEDDDTITITPVGPLKQDLIAADARLSCEEIGSLNYSTWATYLLLMQSKEDTTNYVLALICASCANLTTLAQAYNFDWELMAPDDITWLGAFFLFAKIGECGLPT